MLPAILRRYNALFSSHTPATLIAALQSWCTLLTECFAPASGAFFTVKNVAAMVTPLDKVFRKGTAVECRVEAVRTTSVAISVLQTHSSVASLVRNIICHACRDEHSEVRQSALDCVLALLNRLQVSDESTSHPVTVTDPVQLVAEITQCLCIQVSAAASAAIQPNADVPLLCSVLVICLIEGLLQRALTEPSTCAICRTKWSWRGPCCVDSQVPIAGQTCSSYASLNCVLLLCG